jgi:DNA polymerase-3 subunit epsilon
MSTGTDGISSRRISDTPIAVIDFETTGLSAGYDRVVEVAVIRIEPGSRPTLALDTLIDPDRPVAATFVHGITDEDVVGAPKFEDVAAELLQAISGCVVAAHNVYFDMRFLRYELGRLKLGEELPHVCTMYSRPLVGLAACSLHQACIADQVAFQPTHSSRTDASAAAELWLGYRDAFLERGIATFRDLTLRGKSYKFFRSFECPTLRPRSTVSNPRIGLKPRT